MLSRYKIISFWWTFLWRSWGWKDRHRGLCRLTFRWLYLCCARNLLWLCWFIIGFIFPGRLRITYLLSTLKHIHYSFFHLFELGFFVLTVLAHFEVCGFFGFFQFSWSALSSGQIKKRNWGSSCKMTYLYFWAFWMMLLASSSALSSSSM